MHPYWVLTWIREWTRTGFLDEFMNGFVKDSYMDSRMDSWWIDTGSQPWTLQWVQSGRIHEFIPRESWIPAV